MTEVTPEQVTEVTPEQVTEVTPEQVTEVTPEQVTEVTPEQVTEVTPEPATYPPVTAPGTEVGSEDTFWVGPEPKRISFSFVLVLVLALAHSVGFTWLAIIRHDKFLSHAFDMGQMVQIFWKIRHGYGGFSTVTGLNIMGDHARAIVYPLAFIVPPSVRLILALQAFALASGAIPAYLMVRRKAPAWLAVVAAVLYLGYPTLQWMTIFDFHPEVLAGSLLLWALWAYETSRWKAYWPLIGVALLCREDVAVAVGIIGVVMMLEKKIKAGAITLGLAVAWLGAALTLMSRYNPFGLSVFRDRYGWLGPTPVVAAKKLLLHLPTVLKDPTIAMGVAILVMLAGYLLPIPFALFSRPSRVWAVFPLMGVHLLSSLPQQRSIYFHYGFLITPLIFFVAADGIGRVSRWKLAVFKYPVIVIGIAAALIGWFYHSPFTDKGYRNGKLAYERPAQIFRQFAFTHPAGYIEQASIATDMIAGNQDTVSASGVVLPHLAKRPTIFLTPNPFYEIWYGKTISQGPDPKLEPVMPAHPPKWVVMDRAHLGPDGHIQRDLLVAMLPSRYTEVYSSTYISVWRLN